jgi:DNA replication and repair protein RecF
LQIKRITIRDFRNLEKVSYTPGEGLNILLGDNAQGKTSFLEAVFMLGNAVSFRGTGDRDLIRYGAAGYHIGADYESRGMDGQILLDYDGELGKKQLKINHKPANFRAERLPRFVVFTPDDLALIKGSPGKRRRFLDNIIRQLAEGYAHYLDNYQQLLRRRNELLKGERAEDIIQDINPLFCECAVKIILARLHFLHLLGREWSRIMPQLSGAGLSQELKYALSFPLAGEAVSPETLLQAMQKNAAERWPLEKKRHLSLIGPHLDDVNIYLDDKPAKNFASQGQQRNMVVGLKLAEIALCRQQQGQAPIVLLDEVLSELDEQKRQNLVSHLQDMQCQTFLTAVNLEREEIIKAVVIRIRHGELDTGTEEREE